MGFVMAALGTSAIAEDIAEPPNEAESWDENELGPRDRNPMEERTDGIFKTDKGTTCMERVEAVEAEHGVFDNSKMAETSRTAIGERLTKLCEGLFGRAKPDFHAIINKKLKTIHEASESFGAEDACELMFKHHDEL